MKNFGESMMKREHAEERCNRVVGHQANGRRKIQFTHEITKVILVQPGNVVWQQPRFYLFVYFVTGCSIVVFELVDRKIA